MTEIPMPSNPSLWRRVTAALCQTAGIPAGGLRRHPGHSRHPADHLALHPLIPSYIWTEEMARFLFIWTIMIGAMVGVREAQHFEVDVWPDLSRRARPRCGFSARLGILALALVFVMGRHRVHAVCLEPDVGAGRPAALADPRRLAGGRRHLDRVRGRADRR